MQIAKEHGGIMRFIQVSCLGASSSSPSRMLRAKAAAEEDVLKELPEVNYSFLNSSLDALHISYNHEMWIIFSTQKSHKFIKISLIVLPMV